MFDIGWSEILVIAVVAIIFVGPRELIPMLRTIGKQVGMLKKMAGEFQSQFNEALREAELDTIKKDVEKIGRLDPLRDIKDKVTKEIGDVTRKFDDREKQTAAKPAASASPAPAPAPAPEREDPMVGQGTAEAQGQVAPPTEDRQGKAEASS